jgi:hypothetical protein
MGTIKILHADKRAHAHISVHIRSCQPVKPMGHPGGNMNLARYLILIVKERDFPTRQD